MQHANLVGDNLAPGDESWNNVARVGCWSLGMVIKYKQYVVSNNSKIQRLHQLPG